MPPPKHKIPTPDQRLKRMGDKIQKARKTLGWTMENLADEANTSKSEIFYVESGSRAPTVTTMSHIADALGLPFSYFFES